TPETRQPYSEQWNAGIQRELFKGNVLSVDYIHNSTLKISQTLDVNHLGAARNFNLTNAKAAITATLAGCSLTATPVASVALAIAPGGCPGLHTSGAKSATLSDFAGNGLDSASVYVGTNPYVYAGKTNAGAFTGNNSQLGAGAFAAPIGRSGYDALQIVYKGAMNHAWYFVQHGNIQVSYAHSRIYGTSGTGGASGGGNQGDAFFNNPVLDNDNPMAYMGRSSLDHSNALNFGGQVTLKYGPRIALVGHFYSAPPTSLTLDTEQTQGGIFQTDVTGDGTTGDLAPGTLPGTYMHAVNGKNLQQFITNFNGSQAGRLTPAGQQVVNSGLISASQMTQLGAVIQPIANLPQSLAINNPAFRNVDASFTYPIRLTRIRQGLILEPGIAFYNAFNMSNFTNPAVRSGVLVNTVSAGGALNATNTVNNAATGVNGTNDFPTLTSARAERGTGTFDQGSPRSTEFQLKLNF
ncbi:MAG: TonB-dependent receptor, partial [Bryocella sp.]